MVLDLRFFSQQQLLFTFVLSVINLKGINFQINSFPLKCTLPVDKSICSKGVFICINYIAVSVPQMSIKSIRNQKWQRHWAKD